MVSARELEPDGRRADGVPGFTAPLDPGVTRHVPGVDASRRAGLFQDQWREAVKAAALELGFARIGFTQVTPLDEAEPRWAAWLAAEHNGQMAYLGEGARAMPGALLPEARSVIVVALPYTAPEASPGVPGLPTDRIDARGSERGSADPSGHIAAYAVGADYHAVLKVKLRALASAIADIVGRPVTARACVDTAPVLERALAERAGLGFIGKSGMLIVPGLGTHVLLGELLVDVDLTPVDAAERAFGSCGSCTACLDACPTSAFVADYVLDARRCVSYLTIELSGSIPHALRQGIGTRVFGCDVCQTVCPYNASPKAKPDTPELREQGGRATPNLLELLSLTSKGYLRFVRRSALRRVSRPSLVRNAAVALGNAGSAADVPALAKALTLHLHAVVRQHAAWALGQIGSRDDAARAEARRALEIGRGDVDPAVRTEVEAALSELGEAE